MEDKKCYDLTLLQMVYAESIIETIFLPRGDNYNEEINELKEKLVESGIAQSKVDDFVDYAESMFLTSEQGDVS